MHWLLLKNSLLVSTLATLLAVGFGLVAALWLSALSSRWRNLCLAIAIVSLALPPFLVTNCWLHFLGHAGVWRRWLPLDIFSLVGAGWILALLLWPIALIVILSAWHRLERAQLESDLAVAGLAFVRALLLPLARPVLALACVLTFVLALNNFAVPAILQVKVFPAEMWVRFNTTFDTLGSLQLCWPLVIGPLLLLICFSRRGISWPHLQAPVQPGLFRRQLGSSWCWSCGAFTLSLCFLAVGLPLLQILTVKRTWTELPGALAAGQSAVWNSFLFAAIAATVIMALSLIAALRVRHKPVPCFHPLSYPDFEFRSSNLAWLPFLLPGVLLGIALIVLLNHPWSAFFYQSIGVVVLAFVIRYLALGWNVAAHALHRADHSLTDAARLDGANRWQLLRLVHWPQIAPQIAAGWYIVFLLCLWDVESMILIVPPGAETLSLRIFNLLHYGHSAQVNALCLSLLCVALTPLLLWHVWRFFAFHFSRLMLRAPRASLLVFLSPLLLVSCSPPTSPSGAALDSKLFSRVQVIGSRGVGVAQLNKPRSVAMDKQDNLYVVDMTGRVQKFSPSGDFLLSWQMPQTDLGKAKGMCRDRDGNIVVIEPHYQRVNHFTPEGKLLAQWGQRGTNAGQFSLPRAVAVNSRNEIFVSEYGVLERIQRFRLNPGSFAQVPQFLDSIGHAGTSPGDFNRPEGIAVDSQDRLYVADSCNHRIQVFSPDGRFLLAYGRAGKAKGELSYPYDICVDAAGHQFVCEFGNSRIQVFDGNDCPLEIIGGPGTAPGQFSDPWSIALDSAGNLYVADSQNHRVQKLIRK